MICWAWRELVFVSFLSTSPAFGSHVFGVHGPCYLVRLEHQQLHPCCSLSVRCLGEPLALSSIPYTTRLNFLSWWVVVVLLVTIEGLGVGLFRPVFVTLASVALPWLIPGLGEAVVSGLFPTLLRLSTSAWGSWHCLISLCRVRLLQ